jgi:hypothetical protein
MHLSGHSFDVVVEALEGRTCAILAGAARSGLARWETQFLCLLLVRKCHNLKSEISMCESPLQSFLGPLVVVS